MDLPVRALAATFAVVGATVAFAPRVLCVHARTQGAPVTLPPALAASFTTSLAGAQKMMALHGQYTAPTSRGLA